MSDSFHRAGERIERWSLIERLGRGGSAEVWRAGGPRGEAIALKLLTASTLPKVRRFAREINLLRTLDSGLAVPMIEAKPPGAGTGSAYIAMPVAEPMKDYVRRRGPGLVGKVAIFREIARALAALHADGIFHCDVKPTNLYHLGGRWVLGDFGMAMRRDTMPATGPRELMGTRHYLPPELNRLPYDGDIDWARCDAYSFGLSLWEALAERRLPPPREMAPEDTPFGPAAADPACRDLANLVARATRRKPAERPDMESIADRLEDWLDRCRLAADEAMTQPAPPAPSPARRPVGRREGADAVAEMEAAQTR